ncbi:MAG: metallophosphoesterase [Candidatus Micrarchaeota archaeon]
MEQKQRTLVVGDVHGRYAALKDVLKKSHFDKYKDKLIILGDVVDRGKNSKQVVEELVKIPNKIVLLGNHDKWFYEYMEYGKSPDRWLKQGGYETLESYLPDFKPKKIPPRTGNILGRQNCIMSRTIWFLCMQALIRKSIRRRRKRRI